MTGRSERIPGRRLAFTLIELLIVVSVIAILAGITLKTAYYVKQKTARSQATYTIQQIQHALAAYHAAYGSYPPAQQVGYEYEYQLPPAVPDGGYGWGTGLVCYILTGGKYNTDPVANEWQHYLEGPPDIRGGATLVPRGPKSAGGFGMVQWTNLGHTILDPWWRSYEYTSAPPDYQSYKLWSVGPDGVSGTKDDISSGWVE